MVALKFASAAIAAFSFASSVLADVDPIVIKGSKFFYKSNSTQFFIRGIAYQEAVGGNGTAGEAGGDFGGNEEFTDPLIDTAACRRDIPLLTQLRTNTIRVYAIDTTQNHDECMTALQDAGIYVIVDLSAPNISINRVDPSWNAQLYARYTSVVDVMAKYNNVLGFFAGNEVANNATNAQAIPFVKAAVRDMKSYIKQKGYRTIGVGYAADDDKEIRVPLRDYVNCGPADQAVDFFGYNIYSYCGPDDGDKFETSGYADRAEEFANYSVPTFFAEYGCNVPSPRPFDDTGALFNEQMSQVFSGGIVYQYFQEDNRYGLVEIEDGEATKLRDFNNLAEAMADVSPSSVEKDSYQPTNTVARNCPPTTDASFWSASSNLPPTPNQELCSCMVQSLSCVAKDSVDEDSISDLFDAACTRNVECSGIERNGTTGTYGAYSMCDAKQQLSWAFNNYYQQTNQADTSCDFDGNAERQTAQDPDQCQDLIDQAGAAGTGVVTSMPTSTGAGAAASSSSGAAGVLAISSFDMGLLKMGAYVLVSVMAGAGMILL